MDDTGNSLVFNNTINEMYMLRLRFLFVFGFIFSFGYAQLDVPKDFFKPPLDIPMVLSGTFGEFRSNHFHAGIDIKTQGVEGLEVKASGEGYISRIRVSEYGYGKAIYISHPNGYQSVYAHLKRFAPKIETYIKQQQYKLEKYDVQFFPEPEDFPIAELELIGYSGNTGSSGGPHLHFEIRDGQSKPMNPFLFGLDNARDSRPPTIRNVFVYTASDDAHVNNKQGKLKLKLNKLPNGDLKATELSASGKLFFGVEAYDRLDDAWNKNGYYCATVELNGRPFFRSTLDRFSYDESRYMNRMIDFRHRLETKKWIHKLTSYDYNTLEINNLTTNNGIVEVSDNLSYNYNLKLLDYKGNTRTVQIPIKHVEGVNIEKNSPVETPFFVKTDNAFAYDKDLVDVYIPKNALYEDMYLNITIDGDTLSLHDYRVPVHKSISIGFDVSAYKEKDKEQLFIGKQLPWGTIYYVNTKKKANRFTASVSEFGNYILAKDEEPPTIKPLNFRNNQWISNLKVLKVKIDDDLTGVERYRATVNGNFILMEYDPKKKLLVHDFSDGVVKDTENNFKLVVTDKVGNTTIFENKFYRKN